MNDASLLAASVQKVQAAKKGVNLPNSLQDAAISDVIVENVVDKVTQEVILDDDGTPISTAFSILGVPFSSLKVDQIRMLCSKWNLKKYRGVSRDKLCLVIAQNQQLMVVYAAQAVTVKNKKMELQASKFRLLNVVFSEDFFKRVLKMNDKKQKDGLDAGKAGNTQRLWSSISDEYNDSLNDEVYGVFAFVEDEQIAEFAETIDIRNYVKLDWMKATTWFKAIVTDYKLATTWFTKSGQHEPNFYNFCKKKPTTYYYRLYAESRPNSHKAFSVVLDDRIFSESTTDQKKDGKHRGPSTTSPLKHKEAVMTRVANSMTDKLVSTKKLQDRRTEKIQVRRDMRMEKLQLEQNIASYVMNVCSLPDTAGGNSAREVMQTMIQSNSARIEEIKNWFDNDPSPVETP